MKNLIQLILLAINLFSGYSSIAQYTGTTTLKLDSLTAVVKANPDNDTTLIKAYVGMSEELYQNDLDSMLQVSVIAEKLVNKALKKDNDDVVKYTLSKLKLEILTNEATAYNDKGNSTKAFELYDDALHLSQQINEPKYEAEILNEIGLTNYYTGKVDTSLYYFKQSLAIKQKIGDELGISTSFNNIGYIYKSKGDYINALDYFNQSLKISEDKADKPGIASNLNNMGMVYKAQGNIEKALEYYDKSLRLFEEVGNKEGQSSGFNNVAFIYRDQGDIEKALEYFTKSLQFEEELGNKHGIATSYNNIGFVYEAMGDLDNAMMYIQKSLAMREEIKDKQGIAYCLNNMGYLYEAMGDTVMALDNYFKSLELKQELGDRVGMAAALNNIAELELDMNNITAAKLHAQRSLELGKEIGSPNEIKYTTITLKRIVLLEHNYKDALAYYELHIQMRDSIKNEENQKAAIRQQTKYEFEKAQLIKEQEQKEAERLALEQMDRRNSLQYSIIFVAILAVFGLVLSLGFINISAKFAEGLIFFAFLILFEFLLVLSDPYVEGVTGGEPAYKLLANALFAGLIFPVHSYFERTLKKRLVDHKKEGE